MSPQIPVEDPSRRDSLVDRTATYVRGNVLLRVLLIATAIDHIAAIVLVIAGRLAAGWAGFLVLMSVFAWFFAVPLPVMNRAVQADAGLEGGSTYMTELVEMFGRVVLCGLTGAYTYILVVAAVSSPV